jgi:thiol-disulfide isomerase/thioredoxin
MTPKPFFCLLLLSLTALGQSKYYKTPNGKILDSLSYANLKMTQIDKFKSISPNVQIVETLTPDHKNADSLVYLYSWNIKLGGSGAGEKEKGFEPSKYVDREFPLTGLVALDGNMISIETLKGKPTLINFWFAKCQPCIEEMPVLNKIKADLGSTVNFIGITFEKKEDVKKFLSKHPFDFTQIPNAAAFTDSLEMESYPVNIFLDRNGKVTHIENGIPYIKVKDGKLVMGDEKEFEEILKKL